MSPSIVPSVKLNSVESEVDVNSDATPSFGQVSCTYASTDCREARDIFFAKFVEDIEVISGQARSVQLTRDHPDYDKSNVIFREPL
jgi:hypothetical protein